MLDTTSRRAVLVRKLRHLRALLRHGWITWTDYAAAASDVARRLEALCQPTDTATR